VGLALRNWFFCHCELHSLPTQCGADPIPEPVPPATDALLPVSGVTLDDPEAILFVVHLIPVYGDTPLIPFAQNPEFYLCLWS